MKKIVTLLLACIAYTTSAQTFIWNSEMVLPLLKGGSTFVNDTTVPLLLTVETVPGYKYTIAMEALPTAQIIPAASFENAQGVVVNNTAVESVDRDDWILYTPTFGSAKTKLFYEYAMADNETGAVEVRLTSTSSPPSATIVLQPTGGWGTRKVVELPLVLNTGTHSIFLTFKSSKRQLGAGGNIYTLVFK